MKLLSTQLNINLKLDNKEQLRTLVNTLITNDITSYLISEETSVIGSLKVNGEVLKSSLPNGYVVTIYSKKLDTVSVINKLLNEY
jgi:hypothetical protein